MHKGDVESIDQWDEKPAGLIQIGELPPPRPTLFNHFGYLDHDIYPNGVADMVGYWAENRILGGVTVFDRLAKERAPQFPPNVYFFSCRQQATTRYYQLRDDQQQRLLNFLLAKSPDAVSWLVWHNQSEPN